MSRRRLEYMISPQQLSQLMQEVLVDFPLAYAAVERIITILKGNQSVSTTTSLAPESVPSTGCQVTDKIVDSLCEQVLRDSTST